MELKISGTLSGHSYGKHLTPALRIDAVQNFGRSVTDGVLGLHNGELPLLKESTAAVLSNAKHGGSLYKETHAKLTVSGNAHDNFAIIATFGPQKIKWSYRRVDSAEAEQAEAEAQGPCPLEAEFERVLRELAALERIKGDRLLFEADIDFQNEPVEICNKNGKATLKGEPEAIERAAGMAATLLSLGLSAAATPTGFAESAVAGKMGSFMGKEAGKLTVAEIRRAAAQRAKDAGIYLSVQQIKSTGRRAEVAEKLVATGMSKIFAAYEPKKISESAIAKLVGDGHLTVSAEDGLMIYRDMMMINTIARANAEAYYCKLVDTQLGMMAEIRAFAQAASSHWSPACRARYVAAREALKFNLEKLSHDLTSVGWGTEARFGTNWTLDKKYARLSCVSAAKGKVGSTRLLR